MEQLEALLPGVVLFLEKHLSMETLSPETETRRLELCDRIDVLRLGDGPPVPVDRGKMELCYSGQFFIGNHTKPASHNHRLSLPTQILNKHVSFDRLGTISDSDSSAEEEDDEDLTEDDLPPPPPPPLASTLEQCADTYLGHRGEDVEPGYETSTNLMAQVAAKRRAAAAAAASTDKEPIYETTKKVLQLPRSASAAAGFCSTTAASQDQVDSDCLLDMATVAPGSALLESADDLQLPTKAMSPSRRFSTASCLEQSAWTLVGPLSHRCKGLKWQRLGWCLLSGCRLLGHKSFHSMSPAVSVFLAGYRAIYVERDSNASHVIKLMCPAGDRDAHVLAADTEEQARVWVEQINVYATGQTPHQARNFMQDESHTEMQEDSGFSAPLSSSSDGSGDGVIGNTTSQTLASATTTVNSTATATSPTSTVGSHRHSLYSPLPQHHYTPTSTLASNSLKYSESTYAHMRSASGSIISNVRRKVESLGNSAKRKASRRAVVSMTAAELSAASASDALNHGVAWVRVPDESKHNGGHWSEKWCQLRPGELRLHRLKTGALEQALSLDGLSLGLVKDDKKHLGALRLSSVRELKDVLHFHVADKIQMGQWIKYFIQALGIVPPVQYESVVDWIPVELYQQFVKHGRRKRSDSEDVYDEVCPAASINRHSVCLPPRKSNDTTLPPLPTQDPPPVPRTPLPSAPPSAAVATVVDEDEYYLYDALADANGATGGILARSDTFTSTRSDPTGTLPRRGDTDTLVSSRSAPPTIQPCLRNRKSETECTCTTATNTLDSSYRLSGISTQSSTSTTNDDDHSSESIPCEVINQLVKPNLSSDAAEVARTRLLRKTSFELVHEDLAVLGHQIARLRHKIAEIRRHALSDSALPGDEEEISSMEEELRTKLAVMEQQKNRARRIPFTTKECAEPDEPKVKGSIPRSVSSPWPEESKS